jgi:hypothetical protein
MACSMGGVQVLADLDRRHDAAAKIPSMPESVCAAHAFEFWTGLLAYAIHRDADLADDPPARAKPANRRTRRRAALLSPLRLAS